MKTDAYRPTTARLLVAIALVAGLAAGCGGGTTPGPTSAPATPASATPATAAPSATPAVTATPSPAAPTSVPTSAATAPPFACSMSVAQPGTVPIARMSGMTVANDGGTGRITIDFQPAGNVAAVPEVEIRVAKPPFTKDPSGLPLDVAGRGFVQLVLKGGTALDDQMSPTFAGPFDFTTGGAPIVEVKRAGDFEAVSTFVVGVSGLPCVRILPPDGQSHLVVEVQARVGG